MEKIIFKIQKVIPDTAGEFSERMAEVLAE